MNTQGMGSSEGSNSAWSKKSIKPPYLVWIKNPDGSRGFLEVHRGDQARYEMERDSYDSISATP